MLATNTTIPHAIVTAGLTNSVLAEYTAIHSWAKFGITFTTTPFNKDGNEVVTSDFDEMQQSSAFIM